ncbi:nath-10 [Pristionchus pacificus]|uniref:Nath-10 n=1 Tax=Pristionchus pacificus TaxID=54126 RepID=A0A2A6BL75_PRIPA|nr:nath-10 [Pristionchus pacificus]|eukprot:PDM66659.1 nath-10 [Pristionchus pacificus]
MGYGGRAMELLEHYYQGKFPCIKEDGQMKRKTNCVKDVETLQLLEEQIAPRTNLPPLLERLTERRAENLDYLGVSFGLTGELLKFWKKCSFVGVYLRQEASSLTGEHTLIALKNLSNNGIEWLSSFSSQFRTRFINLLPSSFCHFPSTLALSILQLRNKEIEGSITRRVLTRNEIGVVLSDNDLGRLSSFTHNLIDHRLIADIVPTLAKLFLNHNLSPTLQLAATQTAVLLAFGLQHKTMHIMCEELDGMPEAQVLALYKKTMRKLSIHLDEVCKDAVRERIGNEMEERGHKKMDQVTHMKALSKSLADELEEAAKEIEDRQERDKKKMIEELGTNLGQYIIKGDDDDWKDALKEGMSAPKGAISVRNKRAIQDMPIPEKNTDKEGMRKKKKMKR